MMNERISLILQKKATIPTIVGVVAFSAGSAIGYILGKRNGDVYVLPENVLDELHEIEKEEVPTFTEEEVKEALDIIEENGYLGEPLLAEEDQTSTLYVPMVEKTDYTSISQNGKDVNPSEVIDIKQIVKEELREAVEELEAEQYVAPIRRVFGDPNDPYWIYEKELASRTPDAPYVIHKDEFKENENDYRQVTLTYFSGDNMMVDELMTPFYGWAKVLGELKFGHGSGSPDVVYIRNDKEQMDWEVLLDEGKHAVEVLGFEEDQILEHSHRRAPLRKFRDDS